MPQILNRHRSLFQHHTTGGTSRVASCEGEQRERANSNSSSSSAYSMQSSQSTEAYSMGDSTSFSKGGWFLPSTVLAASSLGGGRQFAEPAASAFRNEQDEVWGQFVDVTSAPFAP